MEKLKIDPEFRDKIPPLTGAEFEQHRENILSDGEVYEPIVTWNGTIIDGHNRWKIICENWELLKDKYRIKRMDFADKWEAFEWMYKKQLGRRNLTDEQKTYMIGKMYEARKNTAAFKGNQHTKSGGHQNDDSQNVSGKTAKIIAKELGIGQSTVERAEKFTQGLDTLREESPEAATTILRGGSGATKKDIMALPSMKEEERKKFAEDVLSGEVKAKRSYIKEEPQKNPKNDLDQIRAIIADMYDPSTVPEFTVDLLVEDIEANGIEYVSLLRNTLVDRSTLLTPENKPFVAKAIDKIIKEIQKVKELAEV